jgi:hypothetical protein
MPAGVLTAGWALLSSIGSGDLDPVAIPAPTDPCWELAPEAFGGSEVEGGTPTPAWALEAGVAAAGHDLAVFDRMHVIPRRRDLGAVLSDQEIEVEVWNAFRTRARVLTAIPVTGPEGIEVDDPFGLPTHFPATQSHVYVVRALAEGEALIDNVVTWEFTSVDPIGTNIRLLGFRLLPWPFEVNLVEPLGLRYGYLTDIRVARDGTEQRRQLRAVARGAVRFLSTMLDERDAQYARTLLQGNQARPWGVPLWCFNRPLTADVSAGAFAIPVDTRFVRFYVPGALVFLWRDPYHWEVKTIESVADDELMVTTVLGSSWSVAAGTRVLPLVVGHLSPEERFAWRALAIAESGLTWDVPAFTP